jgi:hypothetical protein
MFYKNGAVDGHLWKSQVQDGKCQNFPLKVSSNILLVINMQDEDLVIFPYTTIYLSRILHLLPEMVIAYITRSYTGFLIGDTPSVVPDMKVCG